MSPFTVRPARDNDLDRLVEIHSAAYPDPRGFEQRERNFTHNPLGGIEDLRVVEESGRIVGHGFLFSVRMWIYGGELLVGAIASVAIAPEARGRGAASELVASIHRELAGRGASMALLYPFHEGFYARRGYAATAPLVQLRIACSSVRELARLAHERGEDTTGELLPLEGQHISEMQRVYQAAARTAAGRIDRSEARLAQLLSSERQHWTGLFDPRGRLLGYVAHTYEAPVLHGHTTLIVDELIVARQNARCSLLAFLARQYQQVDDVELTVPLGDSLLFAFHDAAGSRRGTPAAEHPLGTLAAGPMVHLIDVRRALESRRYRAEGALSLGWTSEGGTEAVTLVVRGSRGELAPAALDLRIDLSVETLASVIAAGLMPSQAVELGLARASSREAVDLADTLFGGPRFQCLDTF